MSSRSTKSSSRCGIRSVSPVTVHRPQASSNHNPFTRKEPMKILLALLVAALAVPLLASAAVTPTYWTPAKMATVKATLPGPLIGVSSLTGNQTASTCVGIGTARRGAYPGFRCTVAWQRGTKTGTSPMWVRPRAGNEFCVSSLGYASCPAAPLATDPRVCFSGTTHTSLERYAERCTAIAASKATVAKVRAEQGPIGMANLGCMPRTVLVVGCTWVGGSSTVRFALVAGRWTTAVTVTSG